MQLLITPQAVQDIDKIGLYIAQDNPRRALSFIGELRQHCRKIAQKPLAYRRRPELGDAIRSSTYGRYQIFFESSEQATVILRILHQARDITVEF